MVYIFSKAAKAALLKMYSIMGTYLLILWPSKHPTSDRRQVLIGEWIAGHIYSWDNYDGELDNIKIVLVKIEIIW